MNVRRLLYGSCEHRFLTYGHDTISDSIANTGHWEKNLRNYIKQYLKDDSVILDIGANIGTWSIDLAEKQRTIHAFEPFDPSYYAFCGNIFLNSKEQWIKPYHFALTNDPNRSMAMTLIEDYNMGGCQLKESPVGHTKLMRIDDLKLNKVDFIKMDCEGFEFNVIQGGLETIKKFKPVMLVELWHWDSYTDERNRIINFITSLGYNMKHLILDGLDDWLCLPI